MTDLIGPVPLCDHATFVCYWADEEGKIQHSKHPSFSEAQKVCRVHSEALGLTQAVSNPHNGQYVLSTFKNGELVNTETKELIMQNETQTAPAPKAKAPKAAPKAKAPKAKAPKAAPKAKAAPKKPEVKLTGSQAKAVNEFGARLDTNRERALTALLQAGGKRLSERKLLDAIYGEGKGSGSSLAMVLKGVRERNIPFAADKSELGEFSLVREGGEEGTFYTFAPVAKAA